MAEGFKIADAYVSVIGDIDKTAIQRSASDAGHEAGRIMSGGVSKGFDRSFRRDNKMSAIGSGMGMELGGGMSKGVASAAPGILAPLSAIGGPGAAILAAAGLAMAPALMAGISGGILAGAGLGVIGLGYAILKEEPAVKKASARLTKSVSSIFKRAAQPMVKPFVGAIGQIEGMMKRLEPSFKKAFAAMAPAIQPLTRGLTSLVENAMPGILKLVQAAGPMLVQMAPAFADIGTGISIFAESIAKAGPDAATFFKDLLTWTGGLIAGMGMAIGWVARGYGELRKFFTSIPGWVSSAGAAITGWFSSVGTWFTGIGAKISAGYNSFIGFFKNVGSAISGFVTSVGAWFSALPGRIGGFLARLPSVIGNSFKTAMQAGLFVVGYMIGSILGFFIRLPGRVRGAISSLVGIVSSIFTNARARALALASALVTGSVNFLRTLPGRARSAIASIVGNVSSIFSSAASRARSGSSSLVNGAISVIRSLPGRVSSALGSIRSSVTGAFAGAGGWLVGAGQNIIQGLISGIRSMIGAAVSAAIAGMKSIVAGAKSALGIGSPSKVMEREVGRWMFPGVVRGAKKSLPAARTAVAEATRSLVPNVGGTLDSSSRGGQGSSSSAAYHFAPGSIVLDASKLRSIQDVIDLIGGIRTSARAHHARTATAPGV